MGDKFLRKIIKHSKNNKKLSYGKQKSIKDTLKELGYNPADMIDIETPPKVDIIISNLPADNDITTIISYLKQIQIEGPSF